MIYLRSLLAGVAAAILSMILSVVVLGIVGRLQANNAMVGIRIIGVPTYVALIGFAVTFFFVLRRNQARDARKSPLDTSQR